MKKEKSKVNQRSFTIVEQACNEVPGFQKLYEAYQQKMILSGQARSTLKNYARKLAHLSLHFKTLPHKVTEKEINEYLANLAKNAKTPSLSDFKFTIYSLRYCYHMLGMKKKRLKLPSIKQVTKLPVVLNYLECIELFKAPRLLKHRILLSLIYSAGLRACEASNLKIGDIDSVRMMIHIRQSKYRKDRYVPLSPHILKGLRKYYRVYQPIDYLFNGQKPGSQMSVHGIQWVLHHSVKKCKFHKKVTLHTLRHSYATHLLEFGMDLLSIKELLGHAKVATTLVYLHVAEPRRTPQFSPLDKLYEKSIYNVVDSTNILFPSTS